MTLDKLKYPIGEVRIPKIITEKNIADWIFVLEKFPDKLALLIEKLTEKQLETPYRDGGWTVRQVVHHCYDSHHNSYTRFKWALTEGNPVIKAYDEKSWAILHDTLLAPVSLSLNALKSLHMKWVYLLKGLSENQLKKTFIHPSENKLVTLKENIGIYAWHCNHHYAHIEQLMIKKKWK